MAILRVFTPREVEERARLARLALGRLVELVVRPGRARVALGHARDGRDASRGARFALRRYVPAEKRVHRPGFAQFARLRPRRVGEASRRTRKTLAHPRRVRVRPEVARETRGFVRGVCLREVKSRVARFAPDARPLGLVLSRGTQRAVPRPGDVGVRSRRALLTRGSIPGSELVVEISGIAAVTRRRARLVHERPRRAQQTHVQPAHGRERSERTRVAIPLAHAPGFVEVRPRRTRVTFHRPRDVGEGAHRARETLRLDALVGDGERSTGRGIILSAGTRLARLLGRSARRRAVRPRGARDALRRAFDFRIKPRGTRRALRRARRRRIAPRGTRFALVRSPRAVAHAARAHGTDFARRVSLPLGVRARRARVARRQSRGGRTRPWRTPRARVRTRGVAETSARARQTVRRGSASFARKVGGGGARLARRRR